MRTAKIIAVVSLIGLAYLPVAPAWAEPLPGDAAPPAAAAPTTNNLSVADEQAVRSEMATLVEDATLPQRFGQLVDQFSWPDRARADQTKAPAPTAEKLDAAVAAFQQSWKDKYHQDFNLRGNEAKVFNHAFARIDVGDFGDAARTAGERVPPAATRPAHTTGVNTTPPPNPARANALPGRTTENAPTAHTPIIAAASQPAAGELSRANNRAVASIPAGHQSAPVELRFVEEGGAWKLEAPGQVDCQQLQDALARHLTMATKEAANWPADSSEAYRAVAHHVFLAIQEATLMKGGTDTGRRASAR